ncbi:MAG: DUF4160 domain-containing protein [Lachnospiraceae bacterium]|nr:DUF4160 domain-containing protein [Lachnospiraceae bacterium]
MPLISEFFGISIYMYYEDHNPPHFHAEYGDNKALIDILNGCVYKGGLPTKQTKLVLAWCEIHKEELMENWMVCKELGRAFVIEPLR